jgi:hypothetical protein
LRQAASQECSTPCLVTCFATAMLQDVRARSRDAEEDGDQPSVFDTPDGEPNCIFVNPFACGVSPLQWRELQVGLVLPALCRGRQVYLQPVLSFYAVAAAAAAASFCQADPSARLSTRTLGSGSCNAVCGCSVQLSHGADPLVESSQDLVIDASDPQSALEAAGLHFAYDSAVTWVTPAQLAVLTEELEAMSMDATSIDITSYYVTDCLLRAQQANNRVTYVRRNGKI